MNKQKQNSDIDQASKDSFPASDSPSWTTGKESKKIQDKKGLNQSQNKDLNRDKSGLLNKNLNKNLDRNQKNK